MKVSAERNIERVSLNSLEVQESKKSIKKNLFSLKFKVLMIVLALIFAAIIGLILNIFITETESRHDSYKETQYNLLVKTEITTILNNSNSTKNENFRITFFGLDMEGEKYRLLLSKGSFESNELINHSSSDVSEIFLYLETSSKDGKILLSKYKSTSLDETSVNLLTGIAHYFVVDKESSWDHSSKCKQAYKEGERCTYNSKKMDGEVLVYEKYEKSDDHDIDDSLSFFHHANTRLNKEGQVDQVSMSGSLEKIMSIGENLTKIEFHINAHIEVISTNQLSKIQVKELNQIANKLPVTPLNKIYSKKIRNEFKEELQDNYEEEDSLEWFKVNKPLRMLSQTDFNEERRHLLKQDTNFTLLSIFDEKIDLKSQLASKKDSKNINWMCIKHNLNFGSLKTKLMKDEACISSQNAKNTTRTKLSKLAYKGSVDGFIASIIVGSFTIDLDAEIKVDNKALLDSYSNSSTAMSTLTIESKVDIIIGGKTKSSSSSVGGFITTKLDSNIIFSVRGKNSPFDAELSADTAYKAKALVWIKNSWTDEKCYSIFGLEFCLPKINLDQKNHTFTKELKQDRTAQISIFKGQF